MNAVVLRSEALGASMLYGQGAGAMPTGSAVVSDIIDLTRNILSGSPGRVPLPPATPWVSLRPHDDIRCAYYLHFSVKDEPGVLARIASIEGLGAAQVATVRFAVASPPPRGFLMQVTEVMNALNLGMRRSLALSANAGGQRRGIQDERKLAALRELAARARAEGDVVGAAKAEIAQFVFHDLALRHIQQIERRGGPDLLEFCV